LPAGARARLGTLRWRAPAGVGFIAFLPGDTELVTISHGGIACVWDRTSGVQLRCFGGSEDQAGVPKLPEELADIAGQISAALSPDGQVIAIASLTDISLWNIANGKLLNRWPHESLGGVMGIAFAPDGRSVAFSSADERVYQFDWKAGKEVRTFGTP